MLLLSVLSRLFFSFDKTVSKMKVFLNVLWICTTLTKFASGVQIGDVRLVDGQGDHEGRVEIYMNDQWGTVNGNYWNRYDAAVVCRQLGYLFGGNSYRSARFGQGSGPIWLRSLLCSGTETHLLDCPYHADTSRDSHSEDASVACNGKVRLVNGDSQDEGRVEIFMNGEWGTVDDDPWDNDDAGVVCRQLGYLFGGVALKSAHFGEGNGSIWLDDIGCIGNETHLLDCPHGTITFEDSHSEDVGVKCIWPVRLANGSVASEGRVEIQINGLWGTISDDGWDGREANVVCYQLGYPLGGIVSAAHFGEGTGPILLENLNCDGSETSLFNCSLRKIVTNSSPSQDAGVACFDLTNDFCYTQPCANNGKCVNQLTTFLCVCPIGFNGTRCENVIDPCGSNPCENNGLCIREQNGYRCICPDGTEGRRCESGSDLCNSKGCKSSENCVNRLNYRFCTCLGTSKDTILCQYEINACYRKPCKESSFDSDTPENTKSMVFESVISYTSLILAICALVAATICFVKLNKMNGTIKQQIPSASVIDDDHVQMNFQHNQNTQEEGRGNGYNKL